MVWPLPRPWSETMVSDPLWAQKTLEIKGFLGVERPFLDVVSQTPRPKGRGRPLFADLRFARYKTRADNLCLLGHLSFLFVQRPKKGRTVHGPSLTSKNRLSTFMREVCDSKTAKEFAIAAQTITHRFFFMWGIIWGNVRGSLRGVWIKGASLSNSGAEKAREEIQHKEFCGPQDPPSKFFM